MLSFLASFTPAGIFLPNLPDGVPRGSTLGPCMKTAADDIKLPLRNTGYCSPDALSYTFSFFSGPTGVFIPGPSGPVLNPNITFGGVPAGNTDFFTFNSGLDLPPVEYSAVVPLQKRTVKNYTFFSTTIGSFGTASNAVSVPVNCCPPIYASPGNPKKYGAYKFPSAADPAAIVTPGEEGADDNIACTPTTGGLTNTFYINVQRDCTFFVELGGGRGGDFPVYANGVDANNVPVPLDPGFSGGPAGIVYGLLKARKGEVLKVFLGSVGVELDANSNSTTPNNSFASGQGGIGTIFGGANGGGSSYIVKFSSLSDAYNNFNGTLVAVAAGGGGASRNASGGAAGSAAPLLKYGEHVKATTEGSAGGLSNVVGPAPIVLTRRVNDLSGGGGTTITPGLSDVTDTPERTSSWGQKLSPFEDSGFVPIPNGHGGGGSVVTFSGSGGGGGGGGFYGGGSGAWNQVFKPNNLHGAGGGGSSMSKLTKATADNSTINVYRTSLMPTEDKNNALFGFGYLVLGIESATAASLVL